MAFMILGISIAILPLLPALALRRRMGIPLLYSVRMLTVFHGWYQARSTLLLLHGLEEQIQRRGVLPVSLLDLGGASPSSISGLKTSCFLLLSIPLGASR